MEYLDKVLYKAKEVINDAELFAIGGCVRDSILGNMPKDFDFCTNLLPDDIESRVRKAGRKPYLTGKRFGTIGFKVNIDGVWELIEVTTYRHETYNGISRKPDTVFITDINKDISRRDFTINAIAYNGSLYDPVGGRIDIISKKIKAVGKGKDRILEDPLRMLRAARFASQLGFEVDPNLIGVMKQHAKEITRVSKERWIAEFDKLLMGQDPVKGIDILMQTDLMKFMLPEVWLVWKNSWAELAFAEAIEKGGVYDMSNGKKVSDDTVDERWRYLLYHIGYPYVGVEKNGEYKYPNHEVVRKQLIEGICARLKFSRKRTDHLC